MRFASKCTFSTLIKLLFPRRGEQCPVVEFSYMGYSPPKCSCIGNQTKHSSKSCISLLECLHAPSHASSPHRLPHTCYLPCMKNRFQNKDICLFVDNPPIYICGHTPIINCVDNPPIYYNGHTPINNCWSTLRNHVMHSHLLLYGVPVHMKCNKPFSCQFMLIYQACI